MSGSDALQTPTPTSVQLFWEDHEDGDDWGAEGSGPLWDQITDELCLVMDCGRENSSQEGRLKTRSAGGLETALVRIAIDTSCHGNITLRYIWQSNGFDGNDEAMVQVSYVGLAGPWVTLKEIAADKTWKSTVHDLSLLSSGLSDDNPNLSLRIKLKGDGSRFSVDDIEVLGEPIPGCGPATKTATTTMTSAPTFTPTSTPTMEPTCTATRTPTSTPTASPTGLPTPLVTGVLRDKSSSRISDWVDVTFSSVPGVTYDLYSSPCMVCPAWTLLGSAVAKGTHETYRDPGPVSVERYYKVGIHGTTPAIYSPNEGGVFPVMVNGRETSEQAQLALIGVPLSCSSGISIQDVVGWQMHGSTDVDAADEIWKWSAASMSYERCWLFDSGGSYADWDGTWFDLNAGMPSTSQMPVGASGWARNKDMAAKTMLLDGLVKTTGAC